MMTVKEGAMFPLTDKKYSRIFFEICLWEVCFQRQKKDTISIQFPAKRPHFGTIGKNHIHGSLSFM